MVKDAKEVDRSTGTEGSLGYGPEVDVSLG